MLQGTKSLSTKTTKNSLPTVEVGLVWLITCLALTIERLYRLRYLHRGTHRVLTAIELLRLLRLSLAHPTPLDSS